MRNKGNKISMTYMTIPSGKGNIDKTTNTEENQGKFSTFIHLLEKC